MSATTTIEWTDATWNPVTGCTKISAGCDHCYAETFAERFRGTTGHYFENGFDVQLRPDKLDAPRHWKKPRKVFVNSMSDLFHDDVPEDYIAQVWTVMAATPQHTYQILTKRHARMRSVVRRIAWRTATTEERQRGVRGSVAYVQPNEDLNDHLGAPRVLPNVWLGVSTENQRWADIRITALLETPTAIRWISAEPLLGPIDLLAYTDLDWVVVGGESGPGARPMHPHWARALRDQCAFFDIPFLFKQWGAWAPNGARGLVLSTSNRRECLVGPALDDLGHREIVERVGKGRAGRELDGATWDQYPAVTA